MDTWPPFLFNTFLVQFPFPVTVVGASVHSATGPLVKSVVYVGREGFGCSRHSSSTPKTFSGGWVQSLFKPLEFLRSSLVFTDLTLYTGALLCWNRYRPLSSSEGKLECFTKYTEIFDTTVCPHMGVMVKGPHTFGLMVYIYKL